MRRSIVRAGQGQPILQGANKMVGSTCYAIDNRRFILINFLNEIVIMYSVLTVKKS